MQSPVVTKSFRCAGRSFSSSSTDECREERTQEKDPIGSRDSHALELPRSLNHTQRSKRKLKFTARSCPKIHQPPHSRRYRSKARKLKHGRDRRSGGYVARRVGQVYLGQARAKRVSTVDCR